MSYSGNYVALGGFLGLQVFNFSGAAPPTALTGVLLSNQPIEKIAWDAANRLYALSEAGNSPLYIFNVTPAGLVPVAGSPILTGGGGAYGAVGLIVVPK
jgi:hypothetical protein